MKKKKFRLPRKLKKRVKKKTIHTWHIPLNIDRFRSSFNEKEFKLQVLNMPDFLKPKIQEKGFGIIHIKPPKVYRIPRTGISDYFYI